MSKKSTKLNKQINQLISVLEKTPLEPSPIQMIDLYLPYNHMFTPAAKRGLSRKINDLKPKRKIEFVSSLEDIVEDKIEYFQVVALGEEKLAKAARMITDYVNKL